MRITPKMTKTFSSALPPFLRAQSLLNPNPLANLSRAVRERCERMAQQESKSGAEKAEDREQMLLELEAFEDAAK